jgi:hypothetical protein
MKEEAYSDSTINEKTLNGKDTVTDRNPKKEKLSFFQK